MTPFESDLTSGSKPGRCWSTTTAWEKAIGAEAARRAAGLEVPSAEAAMTPTMARATARMPMMREYFMSASPGPGRPRLTPGLQATRRCSVVEGQRHDGAEDGHGTRG